MKEDNKTLCEYDQGYLDGVEVGYEIAMGKTGMSRGKVAIDEAIAIIRKEYLCVDRDCDIERSCYKCDLMMPSKEPILEAYRIALTLLERERKKYERERHCDCCGVLLTEENNKCGYELCDECNERLEQSMERGRNEKDNISM